MRTTARTLVAAAALGVLSLAGAPAAFAQTADYTGGTDTAVKPNVITQQTPRTGAGGTGVLGSNTPATLPFTGGEVVVLAAAGAAAVVAGTAMVMGGRRRSGAAG